MFKLLSVLAVVSAFTDTPMMPMNEATEQWSAKSKAVVLALLHRGFKSAGPKRVWVARLIAKGWRNPKHRNGYMRLYKKYGAKKLAMFIKWQERTWNWWAHSPGKGKVTWAIYKKVGFALWWKWFGKTARKAWKVKGVRKWWRLCMRAATKVAKW